MSTAGWIVVVVAAVVMAAVIWKVFGGRSSESSVDSFRRQIDALGPEARRSTVDQVQSVAGGDLVDDAGEPDVAGEPDDGGAHGA